MKHRAIPHRRAWSAATASVLAVSAVVVGLLGPSTASAAPPVQTRATSSWSGYTVDTGTPGRVGFTVSDTFTVPAVDCRAVPDGLTHIWAGLGGLGTNLAQAGVVLSCKAGRFSAWPFYETVSSGGDNTMKLGSRPVRAGDRIAVSVCGDSGYYPLGSSTQLDGTPCVAAVRSGTADRVHMSVTVTRGEEVFQWNGTKAVSNTLTRAECIVERDQEHFPNQAPVIKFEPITQECTPIRTFDTNRADGSQVANFASPQSDLTVLRATAARQITYTRPCRTLPNGAPAPNGQCSSGLIFTAHLMSVGPSRYATTEDSGIPTNTVTTTWLQAL